MSNRITYLSFIGVLICCAPAISAEDRKEPRPAIFQKLVDCRAIADPAARLACYDSQVASIDEAEAKSEVVVVDRAQIRQARRSLFGLSLPNFKLFGKGEGADEKAESEEIEATIRSAYQFGHGKWAIVLDDGARWLQSDSGSIRDPKPGQKVRIRRAAFGSFLANINGQTAIRVHRQN